MDIYEALNELSWKKKEYFLWKHDLYVLRTEPLTEEQLCDRLDIKSLSYMRKWEKSSEYLALIQLNIESQTAKDLEQIYEVVRKQAMTGDEKSIKMLMELQKQARAFSKTVIGNKNSKSDDDIKEDAYSELEL